jgi:hypothetical protein
MAWTIEYYEQQSGTQPAEVFEDQLDRDNPRLSAKLARAVEALEASGHQLGGGLIEKCHNYPGLWEVRVIQSNTLARELFGFDGSRIVLLHGYVKRVGVVASARDLNRAAAYLKDYMRTRLVSPELSEAPHE